MPTSVVVKPARTSSRWEWRLAMRCAMPDEARMPIVAGTSMSPVWIAENPRSCCRNTEITKKTPWSTSHCTVCVTSPRFDVLFLNSDGETSGARPWRSRACAYRKKTARISAPTATRIQTRADPQP